MPSSSGSSVSIPPTSTNIKINNGNVNSAVSINESLQTNQKSTVNISPSDSESEIDPSGQSTASRTTTAAAGMNYRSYPHIPYVMKHIYINVVYQHLPKPKVGYGVYFGDDDTRRVSDFLPVESGAMVQVLRAAKLMALKEALRQVLLEVRPSLIATPKALNQTNSTRQNGSCLQKYCIITNSTDLKSLINKWTPHWFHDELNSYDNFKTTLMNACMLHDLVNVYYHSLQLGPLMVYHVDDVSFDVTKGLRQAWFLANSACVTKSNADIKPIKFDGSEDAVSPEDAGSNDDDEHTLFPLHHDDNMDKAFSNDNNVDQKGVSFDGVNIAAIGDSIAKSVRYHQYRIFQTYQG
ncbi:unnamed protein product [Ambrosiozyma monospora]|uniref:Unnamed protein product n=1 Tax=Ambrosiozyma monospora TaxID=43982 RepID=A0ACB5TYH7_AMBMO|nr:unnamed protein product [Ambrosiozyma monospora]